jgi:hypothetical protein
MGWTSSVTGRAGWNSALSVPRPTSTATRTTAPTTPGGSQRFRSSKPTVPGRSELSRARKCCVFATVGLALLLGMIDQTAVATALPVMHRELETSLAWIGWTITGYGLDQIVAMPIAGTLSEQFGHRRVFLSAIAIFP